MISSTMDPQLAAKQADTKDLIRVKQEMNGLRDRLSEGESTEKKLRKACQNFEAVFIGKLWQQMRKSVQKEGYLHSKQEESYISMFDRDFSEKMAQAGGIGLADMIYSQLSEKLKETSKTTLAGGVAIKPLNDPQPIGIGPRGAGIPLNTEKGMTLEDWGGSESINSSGEVNVSTASTQAAAPSTSSSRPLTDVEVQARLDELTRRLDAQRIRDGLMRNGSGEGSKGYSDKTADNIGRKLAEIG